MLTKTFNNAAFRDRENSYRQKLGSLSSGKSSAYDKIEVIFGLFKLRSREMERLEGEIGHSRFHAFKDDAQKELDRLTTAQIKLLLKTTNDIPALLKQAQNDAEYLTIEERANLRECATLYRDYAIRGNPETQNLYRALQRVKRQADDSEADTFEARKPYIQKSFDIRRAIADSLVERHGGEPMDYILGGWSPHKTYRDIASVIERLRAEMPAVIREIRAAQSGIEPPMALPVLPKEKQTAFFKEIVKMLLDAGGWDKDALKKAGVVYKVLPTGAATSGSGQDITIALDVDEENFMNGLISALHETGHAFCFIEGNRWPERMKDQPVADVLSLDVHEGMAALLERALKDPKFFELLQPMLKKYFGEHEAFSADNLYKLSIWPKFDQCSDWWTNSFMRPVNCVIMTLAEKKILDGEMTMDEVPEFHRQCWKEFMGEDFEPEPFDDEAYWYDYQGYTWTYQASEFLARPLADKVKVDIEANPPKEMKEYLGRYIGEGRKILFGTGSVYTAQQVYDRVAAGRDLVGDYMQSLKKEIRSLIQGSVMKPDMAAAPMARPA